MCPITANVTNSSGSITTIVTALSEQYVTIVTALLVQYVTCTVSNYNYRNTNNSTLFALLLNPTKPL